MKFIRFGGLSPLKQDHYDTSDEKGFHNPPRKRGFYTFPYPYIERFLLGSTREPSHISGKSQWLKDEDGNRIKSSDFYIKDAPYDEKLDSYPINPKYLKLLKKLNIKIKDIASCMDKRFGKQYDKLLDNWDNETKEEREHRFKLKDENTFITILKKPKIFEYGGDIWHHLGKHLKPHQIIETSGSWVKTDMDTYFLALKSEFHETKREMIKNFSQYVQKSELMKKDPYKRFYAKDHLEVFIEKL